MGSFVRRAGTGEMVAVLELLLGSWIDAERGTAADVQRASGWVQTFNGQRAQLDADENAFLQAMAVGIMRRRLAVRLSAPSRGELQRIEESWLQYFMASIDVYCCLSPAPFEIVKGLFFSLADRHWSREKKNEAFELIRMRQSPASATARSAGCNDCGRKTDGSAYCDACRSRRAGGRWHARHRGR